MLHAALKQITMRMKTRNEGHNFMTRFHALISTVSPWKRCDRLEKRAPKAIGSGGNRPRRHWQFRPLALSILWIAANAATSGLPAADPCEAARGVLNRISTAATENVIMELIASGSDHDVYEYESSDGVLILRGSSAVALCRAFHDYAVANGMGRSSWAEGQHIRIPPSWPSAEKKRHATPFEIRHAYNAVTAGYTFPFWTWERWERELDWQALRGFNLLMAPVAAEAIMERVWLRAGLTQEEIDAYTCGPAHLPFLRMGCICGIGGPLHASWHKDQVALQHRILSRMRELGMQPVVQGFNGFVPRSFPRIHPEAQLHNTLWNPSIPPENRPLLVSPDDPQFAALTKSYIEEWQREFGPATYFLVDSFNEMDIPESDRPVTELLAEYGAKTWNAILESQPNAVWTIQGWTFGYKKWPDDNLAALFSRVPDDRMLVLDYAHDYFQSWKRFKAFHGKSWVCGYVPNMGGKTAYTGKLDMYAKHSADLLEHPDRGKLVGFSISGEGLENNEMLYELLADMAWSATPIDTEEWLEKYSLNRYGACPPAIAESWNLLRQGCYGTFFDHPRFTWQRGGAIDRNPNFFLATERFLAPVEELKGAPLYRADALERTALALSLRTDEWYALAKQAHKADNEVVFQQATERTLELLTQIDLLMEAHPYHRLERWIAFAKAHSDDQELQRQYEANAKCIVTYWAQGVQNYSARVWGGLVRDYYREWIRQEFEAMKQGTTFNAERFMIDYYTKTRGCSNFTPCPDPIASARSWLEEAMTESLPELKE
jgi:alpha-N-acetylglucosaminidase